ncbi:MAG: DUF2934 domain-containing protein [Nitrospira sp.]|nr:DUF2934 domain-containing protein [Nitrospira sp.]
MKPKIKKQSTARSKARDAGRPVTNTIELPEKIWERISLKAFDLWRERGCREGYALQDWLDAERVVMGDIHEARE